MFKYQIVTITKKKFYQFVISDAFVTSSYFFLKNKTVRPEIFDLIYILYSIYLTFQPNFKKSNYDR